MDSDHKMYVYIAIAIAFVVMGSVGSCVYDSRNQRQAITDMVKAGADPIVAGCSVHMSESTNATTNLALCSGRGIKQ